MLRNIELQRKGRLYTSVGELGTTPLSTIWSNSGHLPPGAQLQSLGITTPPGCRTDKVNNSFTFQDTLSLGERTGVIIGQAIDPMCE